ncbi:MAG: hypothetical protein K5685_00095 [Bacteroidales bacterium]|nr:hypothetical protein [Bacteroidales bacterium]
MKTIVILFCILFIFSCSNKKILPSNPIEHFTITKKIKPQKVVNLERYNILRPNNCIRFKNWYVLSDYGDKDNHIKFLSLDFSEVISGVREGNGPFDVVGAFELHLVDDSVFIMDINHKKILTVDVNANQLITKVSSYGNNMWVGCLPITRDRFIDENYSDSSMYQLKDRNNKTIMSIDYPADENLKELSYIAQNSVYFNTKFCVSPDKTKYAFGVSFTGMYGFGTIVNLDSITLDRILPYYSITIQNIIDFGGEKVVPANTSMLNVCSCTSSKDYAIFLFEGNKYGEMNKYGTSILLYTWNGEPYMRLDIDDNVSYVYYDIERNIIVGIAHNPEAQLVEYDMGGIIK